MLITVDIVMMTITGWSPVTNAKSSDRVLPSDALHLHEPGRLQLCIWLVLRITQTGRIVIIIINSNNTIAIFFILGKASKKNNVILGRSLPNVGGWGC